MDAKERADQLQMKLVELETVQGMAFEFELAQKIYPLVVEDEGFRDDLAWRAEVMAFQFKESSRMDREESDFHYLPLSSYTTKDGVVHEQPSASEVTHEVVDYWLRREDATNNPILKARYAGLVWEFGKKHLHMLIKHDIAVTHIKSLLMIAEHDLCSEPIGTIDKLLRALSIACAFNDDTLIAQCKRALTDYEHRVGEDHHPGLWGFSFDALMHNKKAKLTSSEKDQLIADLESRLQRLTSVSGDAVPDHWAAEAAASRLADYYKSKNDLKNMGRVLDLLGGAWNIATSKASPLQASAWLEQLHSIYESYGRTADAEETLKKVHALGPEVLKSMKPIEHRIEIPAEQYEQSLAKMVDGGAQKALLRITGYFIPKQERVKQLIDMAASSAPLTSLITKQLIDHDGYVIATVGPTNDDISGNVVQRTAQLLQLETPFLEDVLTRYRETYKADANSLVDRLYSSPAFKNERREFFIKGLNAYFREDYLAAIHILIPQIEEVVRHLLEKCGGSALKKNRMGGYDLRSLDDLLRDPLVVTALREDMAIYLRVLLTDKRGWNLRNELSHGMLAYEVANRPIVDRIIHALLCLAMIKEEKHKINLVKKDPKQCSSKELASFAQLVRQGDEVEDARLETRIGNSTALVFLYVDDQFRGIAALKRPNSEYRDRVFAKAGAKNDAERFLYELGWIYVADEARGKGLSRALVNTVLSDINGLPIFATTRADNERMQKTLQRSGFKRVGNPYSGRDDRKLLLYLRESEKSDY